MSKGIVGGPIEAFPDKTISALSIVLAIHNTTWAESVDYVLHFVVDC